MGDLIDATAPAQARAALRQLDGGLSRRLAELREALIEVAGAARLRDRLSGGGRRPGPARADRRGSSRRWRGRIERLLATAPVGERLREGALLVLAGRPNAGKSSLFNALLGTDRALVTEVPGTTRDAIEAHTDFLGWPVRLVDTAGLWDAADRIDRLGVEVSRRYLAAADLVLLCVETGREVGRGRGGDRGGAADAGGAHQVRSRRAEPGEGLAGLGGDRRGARASFAAPRRPGCSATASRCADLEPALDPRAAPHRARPGAGRAGAGTCRTSAPSATRCSPRITCAKQRPPSTSSSGRWIWRRCWIGCSRASASGSSKAGEPPTRGLHPPRQRLPPPGTARAGARTASASAAFGHQGLGHSIAEVVAGPLRKHAAADQPRGRAHAAREVAQPETESALLQVGLDHAAEKRLHLAQPVVLPARVAEIVGRVEPGRHGLRGVDGQPFVDQQLAKRRPAPGGPVVVVAAALGHQPAHVAAAARRGVAHGVRQLVPDPERNQVGRRVPCRRSRD